MPHCPWRLTIIRVDQLQPRSGSFGGFEDMAAPMDAAEDESRPWF
jgi:hypothetical protein